MEFRNSNPLLANDFPTDFIPSQKGDITKHFKFKFSLIDGDRIFYFEDMPARNDSLDPLDFSEANMAVQTCNILNMENM